MDCVSGPATDNSAGVDYIEQRFGKRAANGRTEPVRLADLVEAKMRSVPDRACRVKSKIGGQKEVA